MAETRMGWAEFLAWAKDRGAPMLAHYPSDPGTTELRFSDGSIVLARSEYEGPFSEVTPGEGVQPPTLWLVTP